MSAWVSGLTLKFQPVEDHVQLLVAMVLADQADDFGENIYPSVSLVAISARVAERTVQYTLRSLEQIGYCALSAALREFC